jgi:UDP-glucuronate 4-epimerase
MRKVLVTGVAGFIGSHVAEKLVSCGDQVFGIDNFDSFYSRTVKENNIKNLNEKSLFRFYEADITDYEQLNKIFDVVKPNVVVHLAAKAGVRPSISFPSEYIHANINGTVNLIRISSDFNVQNFVFASSSSVYGSNTLIPFREDHQTDCPESPYAASKKAAESFLYTYHRLSGIPISCLRFFTVYGPRQRPDLAIHKFVRLIEDGKPIPFYGNGESSRDYTFISDIVDGIISAIGRPNDFQIYNLGNNHPVKLSYLVNVISESLGKQVLYDNLPEQPGDVPMTFADISKAREFLNYEPKITFENGISEFVNWFRALRMSI